MKVFILLAMLTNVCLLRAQTTELTNAASDPNHGTGILPTFFSKDSAKGSPYLVKGWLRGTLELNTHQRLPETGHPLFFNYDKMNERLFVTDGRNKPWTYSRDSIDGFELIDSDTNYEFEKVPLISRSHLLRVLVRSDSGYSLYKRIITKFITSDYKNEVYWTTGRNYDMYVDNAEYYVVYPGHKNFRKLNLNVREIKRSFPSETDRLDKFFAQDSGPVDEKVFVALLQNLNEQHGFRD